MKYKIFKNFKEANKHYNFSCSYQIGSCVNDKGVYRSFSNMKYEKDIYKDDFNVIYYLCDHGNVKKGFLLNKKYNTKVRVFLKVNTNITYDLGLYKFDKYYKNYAKLIR